MDYEVFDSMMKVWPSGEIAYPDEEIPSHLSDDYILRHWGYCFHCETEIIPHYDEPIGSCDCRSREWY